MILPLKTRMLEYALEKDGTFTIENLMEDLGNEYGDRRDFRLKRIEEYLMAYCGVGILEFKETEDGNVGFFVTDYGKENEKYIPGH